VKNPAKKDTRRPKPEAEPAPAVVAAPAPEPAEPTTPGT
jgi:hypothetical protein